MKIAFGSDHAARDTRGALIEHLRALGLTVEDCGYAGEGSADYPEYARIVAEKVVSGSADFGVLACGTGIGMSIAANKIAGIRCALCNDAFSARMARQHNDANVLAVGVRVAGAETLKLVFGEFFSNEYSGRYDARLQMIRALEQGGR